MSERDAYIYVSESEKKRLRAYGKREFGTEGVADGAILSLLLNEVED